MGNSIPALGTIFRGRRLMLTTAALGLLLVFGFAQSGLAQTGSNQLNFFKNYFVTGDYVVAGWVEASSNGGYATGTISVPDLRQPFQEGVPATVPTGADIVAAYLYWATVEKSQSAFAGQKGFFNGYAITGTILGNPNAPTSWSSGGCSGSSNGATTMRTYRADVRPYLPLDTDSTKSTFGAIIANGSFPVRLADSGSNGNTAPKALGATLVIVYRILSAKDHLPVPLNGIVIYDGAYAPSNAAQTTSQTLAGFYQPANSPFAKLTHIVANGQPNKFEQVYINSLQQPLFSRYGTLPPFPGIYGAWDNPTWVLSSSPGYVNTADTSETTLVVPSASNSGCVSWGATILSTTVQDTDSDGLLDVWESNHGYTDAASGQWVALPGANPNEKDIFVEADYLTNLDGSAGGYLHSHLPKQAALDAVGDTFRFGPEHINVHFDLGPGIYQGDPYVISYPVPLPNPLPIGTSPPQAGTGGKAISEGLVLCTDGATLCAFPGQPAISWKGGFEFIKNELTLGNFQPGRGQSYHYLLFGHSLGAPREYWSTYGSQLLDPKFPQLVSIVNSGTTATVTIQSPQELVKPGDCSVLPPLTPPAACNDANNSRVTIAGALGQPALNGTYFFNIVPPVSPPINNITTTTFTITTANVANGNYNFSNEPQLGVAYLGPTSTSGHSDFGGGGDSAVTLGLWGADDPAGCILDPSQTLGPGQAYCNNQVGTTEVQTGTLLHELGHSLTLTHGGTYYNDPGNPSVATYELNCKSNFLSVMNYLFQVRGFVDGGFDYSGQELSPLNEAYPALSESLGIGSDTSTGQQAAHLTRWYSAPNALDTQLQKTTGGRYATAHCDGTPLLPNESPSAVRVDGTVAPGGTNSAPLDWNNDLVPGDPVISPGEDLNHNGITGDSAFSGFNDWKTVDLQQMGARASSFGFSGGGIGFKGGLGGGGIGFKGGNGVDNEGGGIGFKGGNGIGFKGGLGGGGIGFKGGNGVEQDEDTAHSTVDAPSGLTCSIPQNGVPGCVNLSGNLQEKARMVPVTWVLPGSVQIRRTDVFRAVGSFPTIQLVMSNFSKFTNIKTLSGTPPASSYTDQTVKNNTTYTYFVTDKNKQGAQSGGSKPLVVTVKF